MLGYANAPQLLSILNIIPCAAWSSVLSLIASIMAIRERLDLDTGQAIIVAVVGFFAWVLVSAIIGSVFGVGAAITGAIGGALSG